MVMEFCPGGELLSIIKKQPDCRLTEDQVRFYASEVVLVLEYVHSKGFIYRGTHHSSLSNLPNSQYHWDGASRIFY